MGRQRRKKPGSELVIYRDPVGKKRGHKMGNAIMSEAYRWALQLPAGPESAAAIRRAMERGELTVADTIALAIAKKASQGHVFHATEIADRTEGKTGVIQKAGDGGFIQRILQAFGPASEKAPDDLGDQVEAAEEAAEKEKVARGDVIDAEVVEKPLTNESE